jgi:triacylglycerol lipase
VDALSLDGDVVAVIPPPSKTLWAAELPRALWMGATWWRHRASLTAAPEGDGRTVMVLPGLFNTDGSNIVLRRYLAAKGYRVHGWGLGRNRGVRSVGAEAERLIARIESLSDQGPVTLIGISLGGIMARMAAQARPDLVAGVIAIASPYAGPPRATNVWRAFERLTGERVDDPTVIARSAAIAGPLPCPSAAIWSRNDGLVAGTICRDDTTPAVEVTSSHLWVQHRPQVLVAVATILAGWPPPVSDQSLAAR